MGFGGDFCVSIAEYCDSIDFLSSMVSFSVAKRMFGEAPLRVGGFLGGTLNSVEDLCAFTVL